MSDESSPARHAEESASSKGPSGLGSTGSSAENLLDAHNEALRLRSEIELLQLDAESKIDAIRRQLRADLVAKQEQMDGLRARVDLLYAHGRNRAEAWLDDDYLEEPTGYSSRSYQSRQTPPRRTRRRPSARTVRSNDTSDASDRILDEMGHLLRGVGEVLAEQAHTAADASSYVADSLQRRTRDRGKTSRDISGGIGDAIDRIIDMPGGVVDRVRDVYAD